MPSTITEAMDLAGQIKAAADDLFWCSRERYTASHGDILKGGNELVSLYARPTQDEAESVAAGLNATIDPIRKARVVELLGTIQHLTVLMSKADV